MLASPSCVSPSAFFFCGVAGFEDNASVVHEQQQQRHQQQRVGRTSASDARERTVGAGTVDV